MASVYWDGYKRKFIMDPEKPSPRNFYRMYGLDGGEQNFVAYVTRHDWESERDAFWAKASARVEEAMINEVAYDTVQKLREIEALKSGAFDAALSRGKEGYRSTKDAVSSYIELEKLSRLLQGQSTENVSIADVRQLVFTLIEIVREEVSDINERTIIESRIAALSIGSTGPSAADSN